jgi:hypothetical protein
VATLSAKTNLPLCFVDASGGALAAMGAGIARALGLEDPVAATIAQVKPAPADVKMVLEEVGMTAANTRAFDDALAATHDVVWLGDGSPPASVAKARALTTCKLLAPDAGELERLATARITRDRIERLIEDGFGS